MNIRKSVRVITLETLAVFSVIGQTVPPTVSLVVSKSLPVTGLASTETLQVNVVNTAGASKDGTAASCTGAVAFYNVSGALIGTETTFTLGTGEIASVKLPYGSAGVSAGRTAVRPVLISTGIPSAAPCALDYSVETYDTATGVTHTFVAGSGPVLSGVFRSGLPVAASSSATR